MIPKVIHYCWFGRNPLPDSALKCIESWQKFFPDYEIKEWNEDNFDVNEIPYTAEAYALKKYAFVSDYARFKILYEHGGIYFDTDVEVIKSFEDILARGPFMGAEIDGNEKKNIKPIIAPGLCIGACKEMELFKKTLNIYKNLNFLGEDGDFNKYTMIPIVTDLLKEIGLRATNKVQKTGGFSIYPSEYFNPLDIATGILNKTENTHSIHWFMASWQEPQPLWKKRAKQYIRRILKLIKRN